MSSNLLREYIRLLIESDDDGWGEDSEAQLGNVPREPSSVDWQRLQGGAPRVPFVWRDDYIKYLTVLPSTMKCAIALNDMQRAMMADVVEWWQDRGVNQSPSALASFCSSTGDRPQYFMKQPRVKAADALFALTDAGVAHAKEGIERIEKAAKSKKVNPGKAFGGKSVEPRDRVVVNAGAVVYPIPSNVVDIYVVDDKSTFSAKAYVEIDGERFSLHSFASNDEILVKLSQDRVTNAKEGNVPLARFPRWDSKTIINVSSEYTKNDIRVSAGTHRIEDNVDMGSLAQVRKSKQKLVHDKHGTYVCHAVTGNVFTPTDKYVCALFKADDGTGWLVINPKKDMSYE